MLQQTTVATVVPYWERFVARFPDVATLAAAPEEEVLAHWAGLGYYRRATALHRAARIIVSEHRSELPTDRATWRSLPGIGEYSAGAIASIGAGERVSAVDANARRVITRWLCTTASEAEALRRALAAVSSEFVDPERPGDWNQAVMELGAAVCRPARPACGECAVRRHCRAGRTGRAHRVPPPVERKSPIATWLSLLVGIQEDAVLLVPPAENSLVARVSKAGRPVRRDISGLTKGFWGFPGTPWYRWPPAGLVGSTAVQSAVELSRATWRRWLDPIVCNCDEPVFAARVGHSITRYRMTVFVYRVGLAAGGPVPPGVVPVARRDLENLPLSALATKALAGAERAGFPVRRDPDG